MREEKGGRKKEELLEKRQGQKLKTRRGRKQQGKVSFASPLASPLGDKSERLPWPRRPRGGTPPPRGPRKARIISERSSSSEEEREESISPL